MNCYIDCEFNSFGGGLISMALVPESPDLPPFYEVLDTSHMKIDPWVAEHVMPILGKESVSQFAFFERLQCFLDQFDALHVVADWPDDIAWLCRVLITGPGTRLRYPQKFTMQCIPVDAPSQKPHNALADAQGLRDYLQWEYITNPSGFDDWDEHLTASGEWRPFNDRSALLAIPLQVRRRKSTL